MLKSVKVIWASWAVVNGLMLALVSLRKTTTEDVRYYFHGINPHANHSPGPSSIYTPSGSVPLGEYPDAGVWPLRLLDLVTRDNESAFLFLFSLVCVLISGAYLWFILRWGSAHHERNTDSEFHAAWFWVLFSGAAGPILLTRLDLYSGVAVGLTMALLITYPRLSSLILAYATLAKLWPGVLASALVGHAKSRSTWVRLISYIISLVALALVTVVVWGPDRLLSPITYQDVRGLQIESVFATPLMVARLFDDNRWDVSYASSKSFEIAGPGADIAMTCASVVLVGMLVFALGFALWRFLRGGWTRQSAVLFALLLVCLLIVSNKVFSPQYIAWVGPLVAVASILCTATSMRTLRISTLIVAALTTVIYPLTYESILHNSSGWPVLVLTVRNLAMVLMTFSVAVALFTTLRKTSAAATLKSAVPSARTSVGA